MQYNHVLILALLLHTPPAISQPEAPYPDTAGWLPLVRPPAPAPPQPHPRPVSSVVSIETSVSQDMVGRLLIEEVIVRNRSTRKRTMATITTMSTTPTKGNVCQGRL